MTYSMMDLSELSHLVKKFVLLPDWPNLTMMVDLSVRIYSVGVHPGVQQYLSEGYQLSKDEPHIHQLDIGGGWECSWDTNEQCGQDKESGQVDSDHSLKEEILKEVCSIDNAKEKNGWEVNCQNCVHDPSFKRYL